MRKTFFTLAIALFAALTIAPNQTAQAASPLTEASLFAMIQTGDVHDIQFRFERLRQQARDGTLDPDVEREAYQLFWGTHPDLQPFIDDWLAAYPDSAYAHTAQGWLYWRAAELVRGRKSARNTHPWALAAYKDLAGGAMEHADKALALDPDLLRASDLMMRLVHVHYSQLMHDQTLDRVMTNRPNSGSLMRGLSAAHPGWGGTRQRGEAMCDAYARRVAEWAPEPVEICKAFLAGDYFLGNLQPEDFERFENLDHPLLDEFRFRMMVHGLVPPRRDWGEDFHAYLTTTPNPPKQLVAHYETFIRPALDLPEALTASMAVTLDWAKERAAFDPYNPEVIVALITDPDIDAATRNALQGRTLRVAPFDPESWQDYASRMRGSRFNGPDVFFHYRGPLKVAALLNDQNSYPIAQMMIADLRGLNAFDTEIALHKDKMPPEWLAFADTIDRDTDFVCPILRAARFYDRMCEENPRGDTCDRAEYGVERGLLDRVKTEASRRGICAHERRASLQSLAYTFEEAAQDPGMAEILGE